MRHEVDVYPPPEAPRHSELHYLVPSKSSVGRAAGRRGARRAFLERRPPTRIAACQPAVYQAGCGGHGLRSTRRSLRRGGPAMCCQAVSVRRHCPTRESVRAHLATPTRDPSARRPTQVVCLKAFRSEHDVGSRLHLLSGRRQFGRGARGVPPTAAATGLSRVRRAGRLRGNARTKRLAACSMPSVGTPQSGM